MQPMKAQGLWPMTTLRGLWPGAVMPRGLWPMIVLRSLWLGGAASPVARAADDDASVRPITEGAKPVASAADASLLFANELVMLGPFVNTDQ